MIDRRPTVDGVRVEALIGRGRASTVWRAIDEEHGRTVALKVLAVAHEEQQAAFERERRVLGRLSLHPRIVTVYSAAIGADGPYLVLEYAPGGSLASRLADGSVGVDEAIRYLLDALEGLTAAHAAGIIHGDVKPANLLVDITGRVLLADLGLATTIGGAASSGNQHGLTLAYAAPELLRGDEPTTASDVYAMGASAVELLTGMPPDPPHPGESVLSYARRRVAADVGPYELPENLPIHLRALVATMLASDPDQRPDAAAAVATLRGEAEATRSPPPAPAAIADRVATNRPKHAAAVAVAGVILLAAALAILRPSTTPDGLEAAGESSPPSPEVPEGDADPAAENPPEHRLSEPEPPTASDEPKRRVTVDGVEAERYDLDAAPYAPTGGPEPLWVVVDDGSTTVLRLAGGELIPFASDLPTATAGSLWLDDAVLVPFRDADQPGLAWLDPDTGDERNRTALDAFRLGTSQEVLTPVFVGTEITGDDNPLLVPVRGREPIRLDFGTPPSGERLAGSGALVAWDAQEGPRAWILIPQTRILYQRPPPRPDMPRVSLALEPERHGEVGEVLHLDDARDVWLASNERLVTKVDSDTGEIVDIVEAGPCPIEDPLVGCRLLSPGADGVVAHGSFWVGNPADGSVYRIDIRSMAIEAVIPLGDTVRPGAPVATDDALWIADLATARVFSIDPATDEIRSRVELPCSESPCADWPDGVDPRHRPVVFDDDVWFPWEGAVFRLRATEPERSGSLTESRQLR